MNEFFIPTVVRNKFKQILNVCTLESFGKFDEELLSKHNGELYFVHFYLDGIGNYKISDEIVEVKGNKVLFGIYNDNIHFSPSKDCKGFALVFSEAFFSKTSIKSFFLHYTKLFNSHDKLVCFPADEKITELTYLFHLIEAGLLEPYTEIREQILLNYVFSILLIGEEFSNQRKPPLNIDHDKKIVQDFKLLVNKELLHRHSLQFFCGKLNVSVTALEKAFKKHENVTPKKWLNKRLVSEIKIELKRSDISIGAIAYKFGFSEVTNFIKFFKSHTGSTPKNFRLKY